MEPKTGLRFLFWCAKEHLTFRVPEFESISRSLKVPLVWIEKNEELPWILLDLASEAEAKAILSR